MKKASRTKTVSKKNQALIKVRILNLGEILRKMKAYENRIGQGPQPEAETSKFNKGRFIQARNSS